MMSRAFAGLAFFCLAVLTTSAAFAQDAAAFYKDKTVKIVVGYGPGGGYDAYARMIAPHLSKAIGATVIVENHPGAGGLTALNRTYTAAPDGLQMMIVNGTAAALSQLIEQDGVQYDLDKFGNLGIVAASPWIWLVSPNSTIKAPADVMKPGLKVSWAASGQIDGLGDGAAITCEALKLTCNIVRGYEGSNAAALAVTRGEMDALYVSDTSANQYVKSGSAKAVATMGRDKSRFFPDLATIFDQVKLTQEQQWWFDFRATLDDLGRILVAPPGLPADRLAFLQSAVAKVLNDPAVKAEGEKSQRYIDFQDASKTRAKVSSVVGGLTADQKALVKTVILRP
jgi:tripartite-type tricarboxylate transporter receptor subunit TctC